MIASEDDSGSAVDVVRTLLDVLKIGKSPFDWVVISSEADRDILMWESFNVKIIFFL